MPQGLYLFCLAWSNWLPPLPLAGRGLDGSPLQVIMLNQLAAICCAVPLGDFCGPEAEKQLQDLAWIGPRVVRHQDVVCGIMLHSPVLPARFGTIFSSSANLEKVLQQHYDTVVQFLERIMHQEEWAVKGMLDRCGARERLYSLLVARQAKYLEALPPGRRYFQEQHLRAAVDQELQRWLQEISRELWTDLLNYTSEVRKRRVLTRKATGSDKEMVLNWAYLVPKKAVPDFRTRIREANALWTHRGLVLECTGPWPPYSFTPALDLEPET